MAKQRHLNIKNLVPRKDSVYQQGYYNLMNPRKYLGDPTKIIFRSSYEKRFATYCDTNDKIISWSSEPMEIKYMHPIDKIFRPYNVDFYVKINKGDDVYVEYLVEIKPGKHLKPPTHPPKNSAKSILNYNNAIKTYLINLAKFNAAKAYCQGRGWSFIIVTESFLFA